MPSIAIKTGWISIIVVAPFGRIPAVFIRQPQTLDFRLVSQYFDGHVVHLPTLAWPKVLWETQSHT